MRIIFSRKGWDAGSGGKPSPIIDGRPVSLPIPTFRRSSTTYTDLQLGGIVEKVSAGRIRGDNWCHDDPCFRDGRWAFGQTGSAQSHLANQGVGIGDVFLFFGLFRDERGGETHHRIYGYMLVESITPLGRVASNIHRPSFAPDHPHFIGEWNLNNTLYVGRGGLCATAPNALRLTQPGGPVSVWDVPPWLGDRGLSYHARPDRWLPGNRLKSVARGQEFVCDPGDDTDARAWLEHIIGEIDGIPPRSKPAFRSDDAAKTSSDVIIVFLRQPRRGDPSEKRSDPFWEFGSFGVTGCHQRNLLNPLRAHELEGMRLAFVQGGADSVRLVHLTPPVTVTYHPSRCELRWSPVEMPLKFSDAPVIINNVGHSDTPAVHDLIAGVARPTPVGSFASKFRSRRNPVSSELAAQLDQAMQAARAQSNGPAETCEEALPYPPPLIDRERALTYQLLLAGA